MAYPGGTAGARGGCGNAAVAATCAAVSNVAAHYPGHPDLAPLRRAGARTVAFGLCLLLAACAGAPTRPERTAGSPPVASPTRANDVLMRAIGLVGTPYRYGGNTPSGGFDCSGLIGFVFLDAAGLRLPRTTAQMAALDDPKVARDRLAPGDIVFFGQRGQASHAGIYVGEGRFVHAPSTGGTVRLDALDGHYWRDAYLFARRVLR